MIDKNTIFDISLIEAQPGDQLGSKNYPSHKDDSGGGTDKVSSNILRCWACGRGAAGI